ncbi:amino acid ABC transporter substrate-binding protein [Methylobacterium sp. J-048]|uniref:amino acid ABC transporter substrate-binding protein n=1 Tax=unclassified Methylobacterium TaxID=2615210 RepID=UPI001FBA1163|nr:MULTISPECIES: amino acid ABC transporter substrate-binding protein [unclassified Methylobacterium]MCJ2060174.1 amino acid ABC transporter substrate-binding protein [Methylobacterium sp. J-048]MCJ2122374.1 amino acid ABC transporter substrate-binding protein [Methylobacterium sp. J-077]
MGTLKKAKESGTFTVGYREASVPFSYLDGAQKPTGFAVDLCARVVDAVKAKIGASDLKVAFNPVNSATRMPLVANGTVDIECGSTANQLARQKQVAFSVSTFVPQFRWLVRTAENIHSTTDLKGKTVAVTSGTNTAQFANKLNQNENLGLTIMSAKDHAESFLLVETGRAAAFIEDDINLAGLRANTKDPSKLTILDQAYPSDVYALMIRRDDPQFKALVDETLTDLMKSGAYEKLYAKWFESPIPPRGANLEFPMSSKLKELIKNPSDKPNE